MKKKKLKLSLKKNVISNLQATSISGGYDTWSFAICLYYSYVDYLTQCNSANGCTTGPAQTMTCNNYSCAC